MWETQGRGQRVRRKEVEGGQGIRERVRMGDRKMEGKRWRERKKLERR